MKLNFSRSGGFGNITTKVSLDTEKMKASAVTKLEDLLFKAGLPEKKENAVDGFSYEFVFEQDGKTEKLAFGDSSMTDNLQNLIDFVLEQA